MVICISNNTGEFNCSMRLMRNMKQCVEEKGIISSPNPKKGNPVSKELLQKVQTFYRESDISKELAGKKEFKSVREGDRRVQKQKRLVMANLSKVFALFKNKYPDEKIGFTKFVENRPPECVLTGAAGTHSVCVCIIHKNFKLKFKSAKFDQIEDQGVLSFKSYKDVLSRYLCQPPLEPCYFNRCENPSCGNSDALRDLIWSFVDDRNIDEITYKQWSQQERCRLETVISDADAFIDNFIDAIPEVRKHDYITEKQANFFKYTRDNLYDGEVLVVADFSENFSFVYQDSVQGVHYNNTQATVHPFAAYICENGKAVPSNCVIISDTLEHNTATFHAFQREFIIFLKSRVTRWSKILYFSDGAGSQYKNRFNMTSLLFHVKDFGIPAEWHFFATAHGKGPSDGLGGTLKRLATRASLQGVVIQTARELYDLASENCNLNVKFVMFQSCCKEKERLKSRFASAAPIPGIRSMHAAIPSGNDCIIMKTVSSATSSSIFRIISKKRQLKNSNNPEAKISRKSRIMKKVV